MKKFLFLSMVLVVFQFPLHLLHGVENLTGEKPSSNEKVTFNFVDVELPVITKFISEITGKNFIFDESLKGKITIISPSKLNIKDAYRFFTSVLELKGYTVVPTGLNAYKIIPSRDAKQKGIELSIDQEIVNESYIARLIQLRHVSSTEAVKFLRPVISRDGHISDFGPGNLLLVIDSGLNIEKILTIIKNIDLPSTIEYPEIIHLEHADAESTARILNEGMRKTAAGRAAPKMPTLQEALAVPNKRLNAIVIFGQKSDRESMKKLVEMLDVPAPEAQGRVNVYFLENADAEELSKVIDGIIRRMQPPGTKSQTGNIFITPDIATNSLVIVSSPADYRNIAQVIKKLDIRRLQVYVEAMIAEVSIDDLLDIGTKWRAIAKNNGEPVVIGGVGKIDASTIQTIISGLSGFSIGGLSNFFDFDIATPSSDGTQTTSTLTVPQYAALFSLSEFKGAVNVLSTPQILTSDNKEAEIVVGENVPIITSRESDPSRTLSLFSSIERQDVGIRLIITPQITEGDYVKLDIEQEISSVKDAPTDVLITVGPTTTKRSTKTSVVVKDDHTVVIGGLMEEKEEDSVDKLPFLGDIPILGWLFKVQSTKKVKTNLLVFLTPHIIRDADQMQKITDEKSELQKREILEEKGENRSQGVKREDGESLSNKDE